ncbi:GGDEF domain-containing protein [Microvirga puerhi]|uniref:diguanylate cyclase n=1 Tax=Microvirga puerhi TaxID=2876078 RepID=A0ABS7VU60_9HYPH|nr:GGDEF domain-containing protein [Microvirga puerhi]MBZ6079116.1 GGDEF domain-containing protein [Microvirga puerhi]
MTLLATAISDVLEDLKRRRDIDPLAGLLNHRGFDAKAADILTDWKSASISAVVFDIDHFKNINDTFGHHVGDKVPPEMAHIVSCTLRGSGIAGRTGGEEFVVLLRNSNRYSAFELAERLRATLESKTFHCLSGRQVTASFGIAVRRGEEPLSMLLARADELLYTAKSQGQNRTCGDHPLN